MHCMMHAEIDFCFFSVLERFQMGVFAHTHSHMHMYTHTNTDHTLILHYFPRALL